MEGTIFWCWQSDHIVAPLGQQYDAKDGKALLIKIK
jgi:hypothetical protein